MSLFLVDEMPYPLHDKYLKHRYILLEAAFMNVILDAMEMVSQILVAHNKFNWYFYL